MKCLFHYVLTFLAPRVRIMNDCYVIYSPKFEFNVSLFFNLHSSLIGKFHKNTKIEISQE